MMVLLVMVLVYLGLDEDVRLVQLMKALVSLLRKQAASDFVLDLLSTDVYYDGANCDGGTLLDDIRAALGELDDEN